MSAGWIKQTLFDERSPTWVRLETVDRQTGYNQGFNHYYKAHFYTNY